MKMVTNDIWRVTEIASWMERGVLPYSGSLMDQPAALVRAASIVIAERQQMELSDGPEGT